jgi:hypothetical protein
MSRALAVAAATGALVVTVAAGALAAIGTHRLSHVETVTAARTQAMAVARQIAVDFFAYDYRHIDADFKRVANESTGSLQTDFVRQSAGVRGLIVQAKAVSTAQVVSVAVVSATSSGARVLLALNRTVTNSSAPKGQTNSVDLQMDLIRRGGHWLASAVKPL